MQILKLSDQTSNKVLQADRIIKRILKISKPFYYWNQKHNNFYSVGLGSFGILIFAFVNSKYVLSIRILGFAFGIDKTLKRLILGGLK